MFPGAKVRPLSRLCCCFFSPVKFERKLCQGDTVEDQCPGLTNKTFEGQTAFPCFCYSSLFQVMGNSRSNPGLILVSFGRDYWRPHCLYNIAVFASIPTADRMEVDHKVLLQTKQIASDPWRDTPAL